MTLLRNEISVGRELVWENLCFGKRGFGTTGGGIELLLESFLLEVLGSYSFEIEHANVTGCSDVLDALRSLRKWQFFA